MAPVQQIVASRLTPPFGWALFYLRGEPPPGVATHVVYSIAIQIVGLVLLSNDPVSAAWLAQAIRW